MLCCLCFLFSVFCCLPGLVPAPVNHRCSPVPVRFILQWRRLTYSIVVQLEGRACYLDPPAPFFGLGSGTCCFGCMLVNAVVVSSL